MQRHYRQVSRNLGRVPTKLIADFLQDEAATCRLSRKADVDFERIWSIWVHPQERKIAVKPDVRTLDDLAKEQRVNVICSHYKKLPWVIFMVSGLNPLAAELLIRIAASGAV